MFAQGSATPLLPVPLDINERRLPLAMGPDATNPRARFRVHAWTAGGGADTRVRMRLNHTLLETAPDGKDPGLFTATVPRRVFRVGLRARHRKGFGLIHELHDLAARATHDREDDVRALLD